MPNVNSVKNKPDFLIIGSAKCGTTTLYDDLATLPELYLPSDKEPSILTKHAKIEDIQRHYLVHFQDGDPARLWGEASTDYTKRPIYEGVAGKAYQLCGEHLKLIMIMRDPVERIYSHLRHNIGARKIRPDQIDEAVLSDPAYISLSDYAMQLEPWVELFGTGNLYCLSLLQYKQNREQTIRAIAEFLGIPANDIALDDDSISNKSSELRYTSKHFGRLLSSTTYRQYVRRLLPENARNWARTKLLPKANVPDIRLSEAVEDTLRARLANVENDIEALLGRRIPVNGN